LKCIINIKHNDFLYDNSLTSPIIKYKNSVKYLLLRRYKTIFNFSRINRKNIFVLNRVFIFKGGDVNYYEGYISGTWREVTDEYPYNF